MLETSKRLTEAAENGEIVTIVYHGGHQAGSKRQISPMKVTVLECRARDIATEEVKNYLISKIEIVSDDFDAAEYIAGMSLPPATDDFADLDEALGPKVAELQALGWHVNLSPNEVSLHLYFKNGQPKKGAQTGILNNGTARPWYVFGPDLASARTYTKLGKAITLFLEQAHQHAPVRIIKD
ncbi:MAG: hypothetical protein RLZZ09_2078 [Pseudomonadota bacterium]|jgi:hypothetical protein